VHAGLAAQVDHLRRQFPHERHVFYPLAEPEAGEVIEDGEESWRWRLLVRWVKWRRWLFNVTRGWYWLRWREENDMAWLYGQRTCYRRYRRWIELVIRKDVDGWLRHDP